MAVTRRTQKDIGSYEPKFIGPLTLRQSIAVGIGVILCVFACYLLKDFGMDMTTMFFICFIIMAPFVIFGFVKPYGMKAEEFVKEYYEYHIRRPNIRKYETVTDLDTFEWKEPENPDGEIKNKKQKPYVHKKDKDYPEYL